MKVDLFFLRNTGIIASSIGMSEFVGGSGNTTMEGSIAHSGQKIINPSSLFVDEHGL